MTQKPSSLLRPLDASSILNELAIRIYEAPLTSLREELPDLAEALRVPILVIDFDTELMMNGILGFLENSTGLYLQETTEAFDRIGAIQTSGTLRRISAIMVEHGVTPAQLHDDLAEGELYEITSFLESHGDEIEPMANALCEEAQRLYVNSEGSGEPAMLLLQDFISQNKNELLQALEARGL